MPPSAEVGVSPAGSGGPLVEVAVALPLHGTYTYRDPREGRQLRLGTQVVVPFGSRMVTGFVVGFTDVVPRKLRDIEEIVPGDPAVDDEILELCRWAASYYLAPLGEILRAALPQGERASAAKRVRLSADGKRLIERQGNGKIDFSSMVLDDADRLLLRRLSVVRSLSAKALARAAGGGARLSRLSEAGLVEIGDEVSARVARGKNASASGTSGPAVAEAVQGGDSHKAVTETSPVQLTQHQAEALVALEAALGAGYGTFLLQGITGSGKTEVYLRLIAQARRAGQGALVLVPEIALTPQLASRFRARFGDDVAVLHSGLPAAQRRAAWRRLRAGEVGIALGARSAVFAPVRRLGIVVVDEEHDGSFKQEDGVRYHARDLAVVRAQKASAVAVLGSATPSLESFRNVEVGRFRRLLLPTRANPAAAARPLPPIEVVDLRQRPPGPDGLLSPPLAEAIALNLAAGEQTILFLNRRGFSPLVLCRGCGYIVRCAHCAVSMTYHQASNKLVCHYCGQTDAQPTACPSCRRPKLERLGTGTERVESVVRELFPTARVERLDRDTAGTGRAGKLESVLERVARAEVDILVGTQMVTKGHDFSGVTLVGVLLPDQGMHLPDFRAAERSFQILEQVAGRAGRGERPGRVIVQTYSPEYPAIVALKTHDYEGFVRDELGRRQEAGYPPFTRMVALRLDGPVAGSVAAVAQEVALRARQAGGAGVRVLGPAEAPIPILRGRTRWQVWLMGFDRSALLTAARAASTVSAVDGVRLAVDVDPQSVL